MMQNDMLQCVMIPRHKRLKAPMVGDTPGIVRWYALSLRRYTRLITW